MVWVGGLVVVGGMATGAGIRGIGVASLVAGIAIIFYAGVCSSDGVINVVIKSGRRPGIL